MEEIRVKPEVQQRAARPRPEGAAPVRRNPDGTPVRRRPRPEGAEKGAARQILVPDRAYRHELKYIISDQEHAVLSRRLKAALKPDEFAAKNGGEYFIRSLYFDDPFETALEEKFEGVQSRDKFRIRIYNMRDSVIKLERKHKEGQYIRKDSLSLSRRECDAILEGKTEFLLKRPEPFARLMYGVFASRHITPRVLVDYTREPYVYPVEDVRITFDKNIRTAMRCTDLFNPDAPTFPATDMLSSMVLEVKFNRYLPTYVHSLIQLGASEHVAASKYVACRRYEF